jgi:mercuric ion transport protein
MGRSTDVTNGPPVAIAPDARLQATERHKGLIAAGGLLGAVAASACCVIPFALFTLGISGAWIANLTALAPYKPVFVAATLAVLALGFYLVYRKPKLAICADRSYCARPASNRIAKIGLWTATVLVLLAMTFSYWLPLFVET